MNGFNAQSAKSNAQIKRRNFSHLMMTSALVAAGMTAFTAPALADNSWANLTPNTGTFTTTTPNVNTTNINVTTPNGIATAIGNPDAVAGQCVVKVCGRTNQ